MRGRKNAPRVKRRLRPCYLAHELLEAASLSESNPCNLGCKYNLADVTGYRETG